MSLATKRYEAWKASKIEESSRGNRKPSRVNESWKPLTDKAEIEAWLEEMEIKNYTIDDDGTVDVQGSVALNGIGLKEIPVQFGLVTGYFNCNKNQLKSLKGAPEEIGGLFDCSQNNITSLKYSPSKVGDYFDCSRNNLTSLEGAPEKVDGNFYCIINKLTSLEGAPQKVGGDFLCSKNQLTSLEGIPEKIGGSFNCSHNKLTSLEGAPKEVYGAFNCSNNKLTKEYLYSDECPEIKCKIFDVVGNFKDDIIIPKNIQCDKFVTK